MSGPEDNPADEHQPTKEEWERTMGKDNQAPARPSEGAMPTVWIDAKHGRVPLPQAVAILTYEWIADGNACHRTIETLRDACASLLGRAADPRAAPDHTAIVNAARRVTTSMTKVEAGPGCYRITFPDSDAWMALILALFNAPKDPP